jgi:tetratricopeptide (TPR) repeat protein
MVKKESAERGYMTPEEVEEHLKGYKLESEKIGHLKSILGRKKMLSGKTREAVYESLGIHNEKIRQYDDAVQAYQEAGKPEKAGEVYERIGKHGEAARVFEKSGNSERAAQLYEKDGDFWEAAESWEKAGKPEKAAQSYEKADRPAEAGKMWEKAGKLDNAASNYYRRESEMPVDTVARMWERHGKFVLAAHAYNGIGYAGKAGEMFEKAGKPEEAIEAYKKMGDEYYMKRAEELEAGLNGRIAQNKKDLTSKLTPVIATLGLLSGLFFLSSNITGNTIADVSIKTSSFLGSGLLIVGLVVGFFWIKKRNQKINPTSKISKQKISRKKK